MPNIVARFRSVRGRIAFIAVTSIAAAQLEAVALVLLVPFATTIAEGSDTYRGSAGPVDVTLGVDALALAIVVVVLGALVATLAQVWVKSTTVARWQNEARQDLLGAWLAADWAVQSGDRSGALASLVAFVQRGGTVLTRLADLLRNGFTLVVFLATAIAVSPLAAVALTGTGLGLFLVLHPVVRRVRRGSGHLATLTRRFNEDLTEAAELGREIKVFDAAGSVSDRMTRLGDRIEAVRARQAFASGVTQPLYQYLGLLMGLGAVYLVAQTDGIGVETLGAVALLLIRSLTYGQAAQSAYQAVVESAPYLEKADEFRTGLHARPDLDGHRVLESIGEIRFEGVGYTYPGATSPAVADIDLTMRRGEIIGLVGPSGSGKSTASELLLRLRRPDRGRLLIDGVPIDETTLTSWRRCVALVPQAVPLVHATLHENITFLDERISRDEVRAAAVAAGLDDLVGSLDEGFDTRIGPSTRNLSGGQVQRIGIARALVRDPQVLVLDEPTSALDVHSEAVIHDTIEGLRGRMLVVVIAHRLSTLAVCDRLVVLAGGRVDVDGPPGEVFEASTYFRDAVEDRLVEGGGLADTAAP